MMLRMIMMKNVFHLTDARMSMSAFCPSVFWLKVRLLLAMTTILCLLPFHSMFVVRVQLMNTRKTFNLKIL